MLPRWRWLVIVLLFVLIALLGGTFLPVHGRPLRQENTGRPPTLLEALYHAYETHQIDQDVFAYWLALSIYDPHALPEEFQNTRPSKDGTVALLELRSMWPTLSPKTRARIERLRGSTGTTVQTRPSLSGPEHVLLTEHFAIHYTLSGEDAVPSADANGNGLVDYVEYVAEAAERSWHVEVEELGWSPPPPDRGEGGDTRYDIYLKNTNYYGYTDPSGGFVGDNINTPQRREVAAYYTYIVLENDYRGFLGEPVNLLRVSTAHEFNHALQFGYDGGEPAVWLYEGVATWIEDVVYDEINDNWQYLSALLGKPELCLASFLNSRDAHPYSTWIFFRYLSEHVGGPDTVRGVWESAIRYDGYDAVAHALASVGAELRDVYSDFAVAILLQMPCASTPPGYPYCFEEAPFRSDRINAETHVEGYISWRGRPGTLRPTWGVQETGANFWRLRRDASVPVIFHARFPSEGHFRWRYIHLLPVPYVEDIPLNGREGHLLLAGRDVYEDVLAVIRDDIPSSDECDYLPYQLSYEESTVTPTPSMTPPPTLRPTSTPTPPTFTPTPTPSPTPSPTPVQTASPTLPANGWPDVCTDVLINGGFEAGRPPRPWVEQGTQIVYDNEEYPNVMARSGRWAAWFGGYSNADDGLYQDVHLPADADSLSVEFWVFMRTQAFDRARHFLRVFLEDEEGHVLENVAMVHNLHPSNQWLHFHWDVSGYRGRTVRLVFHAQTDETEDLTNFYVDDVAILACSRPPAVRNGGFEEGVTLWKVGGDQPTTVVTDVVHSGTQAVRLGEPVPRVPQTSATAWISQQIPVPERMARPMLHYWYRIFTNDIRDYSRFKVLLLDRQGTSHLLLDAGYDSANNAPPPNPGYDMGWQEGVSDLTPYRGQWVTLILRNENSHPGTDEFASLGIWTYVDDVLLVDGAPRGNARYFLPVTLCRHRMREQRNARFAPFPVEVSRKSR